jgi:hypothetical protein
MMFAITQDMGLISLLDIYKYITLSPTQAPLLLKYLKGSVSPVQDRQSACFMLESSELSLRVVSGLTLPWDLRVSLSHI